MMVLMIADDDVCALSDSHYISPSSSSLSQGPHKKENDETDAAVPHQHLTADALAAANAKPTTGSEKNLL